MFDLDIAKRFMETQFANVTLKQHPTASEAQLAAFRNPIEAAFDAGEGLLEVEKESALLISMKPR